MYLDERLRYAPFRASPATRQLFFRELLPLDEEAVLCVLPTHSPFRPTLRSILAELHRPLVEALPGPPLRLLAVGDCLMNELRVFLPTRCQRDGVPLDMRAFYFSGAMDRARGLEEVLRFLEEHPMDLIAVSFLTYKATLGYRELLHHVESLDATEIAAGVQEIARRMEHRLQVLRAHTDAPILVHAASGLPLGPWRKRLPGVSPLSSARRALVDQLNHAIRSLVERTPNVLIVDEAAVAQAHGHRSCAQAVIPRRIARGAFFHVARFGAYLCEPYAEIIRSYHQLRHARVVVVTLQGTLWEGAMADGALRHHHDRQLLLRQLTKHGILLVAVTEGDLGSVRWEDLSLRPGDFVLQKPGRRLDSDVVRECATELNLGLDTFVLIDAHPAERVRSELPTVVTLDARDPFTWRSLALLRGFANTRGTAEARSRTALYRQMLARRTTLARPLDQTTLMHELAPEVSFGRARPADLDRITELIQRTNQFNTTAVRYRRQELGTLLASERHRIYVATLADRLGSLGLVTLAIVERDGRDAVIQAFVMSCRALGLQLERLFLRLVLDAEADAHRFIGRLVPTDRNFQTWNVFRDAGFRPVGSTEWVFERGMSLPTAPTWFRAQRH